ncbi:hypothetical protein D3C80_1828970 [compost metagenome]
MIVLEFALYLTNEPEPVHELAQDFLLVSDALRYGVHVSVVVPVSAMKVQVFDM